MLFVRPGIERAIRWSLAAVGVSGILSLVDGVRGVSYTDPFFIVGGALWAIALPIGAILCAVFFGRMRMDEPRAPWATGATPSH